MTRDFPFDTGERDVKTRTLSFTRAAFVPPSSVAGEGPYAPPKDRPCESTTDLSSGGSSLWACC